MLQPTAPFQDDPAQKPFDPEGDGYDYKSARDAGLVPDETGHWESRHPRTGQILKGRKHDTYSLTVEDEEKLGNTIQKGYGGKYYSHPKGTHGDTALERDRREKAALPSSRYAEAIEEYRNEMGVIAGWVKDGSYIPEQDEHFNLLQAADQQERVGFWEGVDTQGDTGTTKAWWEYLPIGDTIGEGIEIEKLDDATERWLEGTATPEDVESLHGYASWSQRSMGVLGIGGSISGDMFAFMGETMMASKIWSTAAFGAAKAVALGRVARAVNAIPVPAIASGAFKATKGLGVSLVNSKPMQTVLKTELGQGAAAIARTTGKAVKWGAGQTLTKEMMESAVSLAAGGDHHYSRIWNAAHMDYLQSKYDYDVTKYGLDIVLSDDASLMGLYQFIPAATLEVAIENWTEAMGGSLGEGLGAIGKALNITFVDKAIAHGVARGMTRKAASASIFERIAEIGWHGWVGEIWEEVLGATALQVAGEVGAASAMNKPFELLGIGNERVAKAKDEEWQQSLTSFLEWENIGGMVLGITVGGGGTATLTRGLQGAVSGATPIKSGGDTLANELNRSRGKVVSAASGEGQGGSVRYSLDQDEQAEVQKSYRTEAQQAALTEAGLDGEDADPAMQESYLNSKPVSDSINGSVSGRMLKLRAFTSEQQAAELERSREGKDAEGEGAPPSVDDELAGVEEGTQGVDEIDPNLATDGEAAAPGSPKVPKARSRRGADMLVADTEEGETEGSRRLTTEGEAATREVYESEHTAERFGESGLDGEVIPWDELSDKQKITVNMGTRNNKDIVFVRGMGAPGAVAGNGLMAFGVMQHPETGEDLPAASVHTLDPQGNELEKELSPPQAVDAHWLHEVFHRLVDKYGGREKSTPEKEARPNSYLAGFVRVMDYALPGVRLKNTEIYAAQHAANNERLRKEGKPEVELSSLDLMEEGVSRTLESLVNFFGTMAEDNNIQFFSQLIASQERRTPMRFIYEVLRGAAEAVPFVPAQRRKALEPLRKAVGGLENLSDNEVIASAVLAEEMMDAWVGAGQELDGAEGTLVSWKAGAAAVVAPETDEDEAEPQATKPKRKPKRKPLAKWVKVESGVYEIETPSGGAYVIRKQLGTRGWTVYERYADGTETEVPRTIGGKYLKGGHASLKDAKAAVAKLMKGEADPAQEAEAAPEPTPAPQAEAEVTPEPAPTPAPTPTETPGELGFDEADLKSPVWKSQGPGSYTWELPDGTSYEIVSSKLFGEPGPERWRVTEITSGDQRDTWTDAPTLGQAKAAALEVAIEAAPGRMEQARSRQSTPAREEDAPKPKPFAKPAEKKRPTEAIPGSDGRAGNLHLQNGKSLDVQYRVVEADDLTPSHDPTDNFSKNEGGDRNERAYENITEGSQARETVKGIAANPKPDLLLTDTPTATDGPPIVTAGGVVLGGNARAMGQQLAHHNGGEQSAKLRTATVEAAERFGVDRASVEGMKNPVLVRVLSEENAGARGELSRELNESLTTAKTATEEAVSRGSKINENAARKIVAVLGDGTLRQALSDTAKADTVVGALVEAGAMSAGDATSLRDTRKGGLTPAGKDAVETALLGSVISDVATLSGIAAADRAKILRSIPALIRVKSLLPRFIDSLMLAVDGSAWIASSDAKAIPSVDAALTQQTIEPQPWRDDPDAVAIARLLSSRGKGGLNQTEFAQRMEALAKDLSEIGQVQMFSAQETTEEGSVENALRPKGERPRYNLDETAPRFNLADEVAAPSIPNSWMGATGDVVKGDTVKFTEGVFSGSYRNAKHIGDREIVAEVLRDSYGAEKQQHTFSLRVLSSSGESPLSEGAMTRRKGRNIYRNGTERLRWVDEPARNAAADEKHERGDASRAARDQRKGDIRFNLAGPVDSPAFKRWFGDSAVVDESGEPRVVYHGTTHTFSSFSTERSNVENFVGRGYYFTSSPGDASANYADPGTAPDLTNRVQRRAEEIASEEDLAYDDPGALARARKEIVGGASSVLPVYLSIQNPADIRRGEDPLPHGLGPGAANPTRTSLAIEQEYDEYGMPLLEPTGPFVDFIEALEEVAGNYDGVDGDIRGFMFAQTEVSEEVDLELIMKELTGEGSPILHAEDGEGGFASGEIIRAALEAVGFDGLIHDADLFTGIPTEYGTTHYIAFKPTQVKSATGNRGTYDAQDPDIRFNLAAPVDSPKFEAWFGGSKVVGKDGKPMLVGHGTREPFDQPDPVKGDLGLHVGPMWMADSFAWSSPLDVSLARPRVYPLYASIKNPIRLEDHGSWGWGYAGAQLVERGLISKEEREQYWFNDFPLSAYLEELGFDGVVYLNRRETPVTGDIMRGRLGTDSPSIINKWSDAKFKGLVPEAQEAWIALSPTQIKSATGNRGTYDSQNADIRFNIDNDLADTNQEEANRRAWAESAEYNQAKGTVRWNLGDERPGAEDKGEGERNEMRRAAVTELGAALDSAMKTGNPKALAKIKSAGETLDRDSTALDMSFLDRASGAAIVGDISWRLDSILNNGPAALVSTLGTEHKQPQALALTQPVRYGVGDVVPQANTPDTVLHVVRGFVLDQAGEPSIFGGDLEWGENGIRVFKVKAMDSEVDGAASNIAHHALLNGAAVIELESEADARQIAKYFERPRRILGIIPRTAVVEADGGKWSVKVGPGQYRVAGAMYALGEAKAERAIMEALTGVRVWEDNDVRFNLGDEVGGDPSMEPLQSTKNVMYDLKAYEARMAKYVQGLDVSRLNTDIRTKIYEDRIKAAAPKGLDGKPLKGRKLRDWVNRMGRALHVRIDLEQALIDEEIGYNSLDEVVEDARALAEENKVKWDDAKEQTIEDALDLDGDMLDLMEEIASNNHKLGQSLVKGKLISTAKEYYTARIWFMDSTGFDLKTQLQLALSGSIDPTKGGGGFKVTMGNRQKHRQYDSILHGWAYGKELTVDNALVAQSKIWKDGMEALYNVQLRDTLVDAGVLHRSHPKRRVPDGFVQLQTNAPSLRDYYAREGYVANELGKLTNRLRLDPSTKTGTIMQAAYKFNAISKATLLFTSMFHHQAFMRSYFYSIPNRDVLGATIELGRMAEASFKSLYDKDGATKALMKAKGAREGMEAVMGYAPQLIMGARAGLTLSVEMDFTAATEMNANWRRSWMERAVGLGGYGFTGFAGRMADYRIETGNWLFGTLGTSLKAQAFLLEYRHQLEKMSNELAEGEITEYEIAELIASKTNDDFGGLNLRRGNQIIGGARGALAQFWMRGLALAPDWTESNFNTFYKMFKSTGGTVSKDLMRSGDVGGEKLGGARSEVVRDLENRIYRGLYLQAAVRSQIPTFIWNALMAGLDDEETLDSLYGKAWRSGNFNWLKADVTLVAKAVERVFGQEKKNHADSRLYFSVAGHFLDPAGWVAKSLFDDISKPAKAKASPLARIMLNFGTGTDWQGKSYTDLGWNIFEGFSDEDKTLLNLELTKWEFGGKGVSVGQLPSFLISSMKAQLPIFLGSTLDMLQGQNTAFDLLGDIFGAKITRSNRNGIKANKGRSRSRNSRGSVFSGR